MSRDELLVISTAAAWSGAVGLIGLLLFPLLRRFSVRQGFAAVAVVSVLGFVAGLIGTANAMFLSSHDFRVVLWVSLAAGVVSLIFALAVSERVVRGSRAVREAARVLGENGSYVAPSSTPTAELRALSDQLASTSARLTESRERERALESSRRELVAWVSHDLRTPLAGLRAMAESLEDGLATDPERYHKQIRVDVERMSRMVDDLFELSRIHAGNLIVDVDEVSISDLVSGALAAADPIARANGIRLTGRSDDSLVVPGDERELSRVVANLVTNALRHTPADGAVAVEASRSGEVVSLSVTDQCGGIPPADLERVFDVAWRGEQARTPHARVDHAGTGAGLGLAIVRGIVEAHRGSVAVANTDSGCEFVVRLPLSVA
jgi:signal transduction histidine kinase